MEIFHTCRRRMTGNFYNIVTYFAVNTVPCRECSQCSFLASFWPKRGARWTALPAQRARTQRTECQASDRRSETKHHPIVCLVPFSLAFSASRSLSPSPDKSETEVVGIAKSPHRVHQTESLTRQYCILRKIYTFFICNCPFQGGESLNDEFQFSNEVGLIYCDYCNLIRDKKYIKKCSVKRFCQKGTNN